MAVLCTIIFFLYCRWLCLCVCAGYTRDIRPNVRNFYDEWVSGDLHKWNVRCVCVSTTDDHVFGVIVFFFFVFFSSSVTHFRNCVAASRRQIYPSTACRFSMYDIHIHCNEHNNYVHVRSVRSLIYPSSSTHTLYIYWTGDMTRFGWLHIT